MRHAVGHSVAFLDGVPEAQLNRVHAQQIGQFVHHRLHSEGDLGLAGSSVCLDLLLVADDVQAVHQHVINLVRTEPGQRAAAHRRAGVRTRLVNHVELSGNHGAVVLDAHLATHEGGRSGAAADEHLGTVHGHLDRPSGFAGQRGGNRVEIRDPLRAKPAADFHGDHSDLRLWHADDGGGLGPDIEQPLGAGPDGHAAVGRPRGGGNVGLDITLVNGLGFELALDHNVGFTEPLLNVADLVLDVAGHVALDAGIVAAGKTLLPEVGGHVVVDQRGVFGHRLAPGEHRGQNLVIDLHQ